MTTAFTRVSAVLGAVALLVGGVAFAVLVVELVFRLDSADALALALVCSGAWCLTGWLWRRDGTATIGWTGFALIAAGLATDGRWLLAALVLVGLAVVVGVTLALTMRMLRELGSIAVEPAGNDEVMADSVASVAEYEDAGFRRAGAYASNIPANRIIVVVLAGPDGDRLALVTGKVRQVVSRFGDRLLVTTNVLSIPVPRYVLRQRPYYGTRLLDAHHAAIEILERRGLVPDVFATDDEVVETARLLESRTCRFLAEASPRELLRLLPRGRHGRPIEDDRRTRRRIDAWLAAPTAEGAT